MLTLRNRHFLLIDLIALPAVAVLAFVLRLDAVGLQRYGSAVLLYVAVAVPIKLLVFYRSKLYSRLWRHATVDDLLAIAAASAVSVLLVVLVLFGLALPLSGLAGFPRSIPFIDGLLTPLAVGGSRFAVWLAWHYRKRRRRQEQCTAEKRVLLVGAGDAGTMVARELRAHPQYGLLPVAFVDDDEAKQGLHLYGLPVLGGRRDIPVLVQDHEIEQVVIAMPSAPGAVVREVIEICDRARIEVRTVPGMDDILSGRAQIDQIREVQIEDLLRRAPVEVDATAVEEMLRGCRVLVTGAGGSIGSELCRQIARCGPAVLVLLGHGEYSIFLIANELRRRWPALRVVQVVADIRDLDRLRHVFDAQRPEVVFHAAAHKHVPIMEANAPDAVTNNVLGTRQVLAMCEEHSVDRFVLISSDKVVRPTSVMGVTKRVAELLVQQSARRSGRRYVAVRFGNVLGSRGSVVPFFQDQIARGGPVTVTDPDVRRYFMTIPEAVQLVLQAAALGQGGEVFMLDMGEPVRIVDLATDLVRLSGLRSKVRWPGTAAGMDVQGEDWDVEVVFTGLRPGEKLFEELSVDGEEYAPTPHQKVFCYRNGTCDGYPADLDRAVDELIALAHGGESSEVRAKLREIVPRYTPVPAPSDAGSTGDPPVEDQAADRAENRGQQTLSLSAHSSFVVNRRVAGD